MDINDAVHALIQYVIHYLLYPVHPSSVDDGIIIQMRPPGDRHTDGIESNLLELMNQSLSGNGLPPCSFVGCRRTVCILLNPAVHFAAITLEGIPEIPAYFHIGYRV